jgi:hypothetical protein
MKHAPAERPNLAISKLIQGRFAEKQNLGGAQLSSRIVKAKITGLREIITDARKFGTKSANCRLVRAVKILGVLQRQHVSLVGQRISIFNV